jgi:MFS family permease
VAGSGWVFLINAVSYAAVVISLAAIRTRDLLPAKRIERGRGQQIEGLRYLRDRPDLIAVLVTVLAFGTFGLNWPVVLPLFTTQIFHSGASAYGLLSAIMAGGSLIGALLAARWGTARIRVVLIGATLFGVLEAVSAFMPSFAAFAALLLLTGIAALTVATTANAVMQTTVAPHLRGRVMGVYLLVFMGGTPIGSPLVGWMAGAIGVRWTLAFCGVATALTAIGAAYGLAWRTDRRILASVTRRPHVAVVPRTA